MSMFKRYLSVLLVVVCLFAAFSMPVSAASGDTYYITLTHNKVTGNNGAQSWSSDFISMFTPTAVDGVEGHDLGGFNIYNNDDFIQGKIRVYNPNNTILFKKNKTHNVRFTNYKIGCIYYDDTPIPFKKFDEHDLTIKLYHTDGTSTYLYADEGQVTYSFDTSTNIGTFSFNVEVTKDVSMFDINYRYYPQVRIGLTSNQYVTYLYHNDRDTGAPIVDIETVDESVGFLGNIFTWVKSIFEKIKDIPTLISQGFSDMWNKLIDIWNIIGDGFFNITSNLTTWFSNLIDNVISLPSNIWNLIETGLRNLFVPKDTYLVNYKDNWDNLLQQRFGGIYEVIDLLDSFTDRLQIGTFANETQQHVYIPEVSLASVGIPFSFGGYTVKIIPEGFEVIANTTNILCSLCCTLLVINVLRKRFDAIIR